MIEKYILLHSNIRRTPIIVSNISIACKTNNLSFDVKVYVEINFLLHTLDMIISGISSIKSSAAPNYYYPM